MTDSQADGGCHGFLRKSSIFRDRSGGRHVLGRPKVLARRDDGDRLDGVDTEMVGEFRTGRSISD